jgi:predicted nucleic acid-binding protein
LKVYLDSSALVKGYIAEQYSEDVVALLRGAEVAASSWLAVPEVLSAVSRLRRARVLESVDADGARLRFLTDRDKYFWLATDRTLLEQAGELTWRHGLRAADAIHLATAQKWASVMQAGEMRFATFDKQLARAARDEGLTVWPDED